MITKTRHYYETRPTSDDFVADNVEGWKELKYDEQGRLIEQHWIEESSVYGRTEYIFLYGEDDHEKNVSGRYRWKKVPDQRKERRAC